MNWMRIWDSSQSLNNSTLVYTVHPFCISYYPIFTDWTGWFDVTLDYILLHDRGKVSALCGGGATCKYFVNFVFYLLFACSLNSTFVICQCNPYIILFLCELNWAGWTLFLIKVSYHHTHTTKQGALTLVYIFSPSPFILLSHLRLIYLFTTLDSLFWAAAAAEMHKTENKTLDWRSPYYYFSFSFSLPTRNKHQHNTTPAKAN